MTADPSVVTCFVKKYPHRITIRNYPFSDANLSALLTGKTFELPGDGEPRKEFVVVQRRKALLQELDVLTLTLTAPESYGIDVVSRSFFTACR